METLKTFAASAALCILLTFTAGSHADEVQDANRLFKQGQLAQALEMVNGHLANKPKDAQARFLKGLIVNEQGDVAQAISIFTELTNDYPELPEPYNNLAVLYAGQSQYEKAKIALEMAIRTHPSYATAHENLGDIYAKMASQAYDRALQLDKNNAGTQTKLALIRDLFGKGAQSTRPKVPALAATAPAQKPAVVAASTPAPAADHTPTEPAAAPAKAQPPVAKIPAAPKPDASITVLKATRDWAAAWSGKNVKRYLGFYAAEFKTPNGTTRQAWEALRKDRISKPKSIKVVVDNTKVEIIDDTHARVSFRQHYSASHFKSVSTKTLDWVKTAKGWQILEEASDN
jgi:tetratricopeptide (TPR) repeat protein